MTLTLRRVAKNGMAIYKFNTKRSSGTVYLDKKMFGGNAPPQTVELSGDGIVTPEADAPATASTGAADQSASDKTAETVAAV